MVSRMMGARASEDGSASAPTLVDDLAPTPDGGALVLEVECRTSVQARRGRRHKVTIGPDWSVTTPHDIEAERVAVAFGAYTSCLALLDATVPAFRDSLALLTRRARPSLLRGRGGRWRLPENLEVARCCSGTTFATPAKALRHLRSVDHLLGAHDVPAWQLRQVFVAAEQAWGSWEGRPSAGPEVTRLVREVGGVTDLWHSGVRPDDIVEMAAVVDMVDEALPVAYYLAMAYGEADKEWIRAALRHRPDPDVAAWLAGLDRRDQVADGDTWGRWLGHGLPRTDVLTLVRAGTDPGLAEGAARVTGWPTPRVARSLAAWGRAGCRPGVDELAALARHQVFDVRVSADVIDELLAEIASLVGGSLVGGSRVGGSLAGDRIWDAVALSRTEVGVMLAVLGNRVAVLNAVAAGVRGVDGLDSYVRGEERA